MNGRCIFIVYRRRRCVFLILRSVWGGIWRGVLRCSCRFIWVLNGSVLLSLNRRSIWIGGCGGNRGNGGGLLII